MKAKKGNPHPGSESSEYINSLRETCGTAAHSLISQTLPQKCMFLSGVLEKDPDFHFTPVGIREELSLLFPNDIGGKKRKAEETLILHKGVKNETSISSNTVVVRITAKIKKEVLEFVEILNALKFWIYLNIPRIEDGNNFGVSVQEDAIKEVGHCEDFAFEFLGGITKYYISRAKLITKGLKYPGVADYLEAIHELDEKTYIDLRCALRELRNYYATLYDMIQKNLEKIEKPRTSHSGSMF